MIDAFESRLRGRSLTPARKVRQGASPGVIQTRDGPAGRGGRRWNPPMLLQLSQGVPLVAKGHQHRIDGQAAVVNGHGGLRRTCLDTAPLLYFTAVLPLEGPPMLAWWRLVETPEPDAC